MGFYDIIYNILLYLTIFILVCICVSVLMTILNCIKSISTYFDNKSALIKLRTMKESQLDLSKSAKDSKKILSLLDYMILNEIKSLLKTYVALGENYPITKLEEDIKTISTNIFESIKKDTFSHLNLIDNEYLMRYISETTSFNLINSVISLNASTRV